MEKLSTNDQKRLGGALGVAPQRRGMTDKAQRVVTQRMKGSRYLPGEKHAETGAAARRLRQLA